MGGSREQGQRWERREYLNMNLQKTDCSLTLTVTEYWADAMGGVQGEGEDSGRGCRRETLVEGKRRGNCCFSK